MESSWSLLSKLSKIPNFLPKFLIWFDQIWRIPKKFPISPRIWPLFTIILLDSWLKLEIDEFSIFFIGIRVLSTTAQKWFVIEIKSFSNDSVTNYYALCTTPPPFNVKIDDHNCAWKERKKIVPHGNNTTSFWYFKYSIQCLLISLVLWSKFWELIEHQIPSTMKSCHRVFICYLMCQKRYSRRSQRSPLWFLQTSSPFNSMNV